MEKVRTRIEIYVQTKDENAAEFASFLNDKLKSIDNIVDVQPQFTTASDGRQTCNLVIKY